MGRQISEKIVKKIQPDLKKTNQTEDGKKMNIPQKDQKVK